VIKKYTGGIFFNRASSFALRQNVMRMEQLEIYGIVVFFSVANVLFFVYNIADD